MKLADYLKARDETTAEFARRSGLAQQRVSDAARVGCRSLHHAEQIVHASRDEPAPCGGTVTFEELRVS